MGVYQKSRKIIHIDMDCFYAAVEAKYRPELRGKPVGIGGPPESRSVLCTANYEARKYGVRAAMPSSQAVRRCPNLILIPPNFSLYKKESQAVREIFRRYTDLIEPLSLDEAYLDVTDAKHENGIATRIATEIRKAIWNEVKLTASAGIAPNKFLAKIASDWKKPNGQFVIPPKKVAEFMPSLKIEKLYGVGKVTAKRMHELGLKTCGDIQNQSLQQMTRWFGSRGPELMAMARGEDDRLVQPHQERKSFSIEETFNRDLKDRDQWFKELEQIFEQWEIRFGRVSEQSRIKSCVVKVKFHDFKTMTREKAIATSPTLKDFKLLLTKVWEDRNEPIRLLGVGVRLAEQIKKDDGPQLSFL